MARLFATRSLDEMPETFMSDRSVTREVSRAVKAGKLRKLASRLYTRNLTDPPETVVRRNLWSIVAGYLPGALIADRTALENVPSADGSICLISKSRKRKDINLPGHTLRARPGVGPLPTDRAFMDGLFLSSTARAYLENMRPSRARSGLVARTLSRSEIEQRLDTLVRISDEDSVNRIRDEVRVLGKTLDMQGEAADLDTLIGALLGTREAEPSAATSITRQQVRPYDADRMALFERLHAALRDHPPVIRAAVNRDSEGTRTLAFFEAYFSNYIEGTEFAVQEAEDIVFRQVIPKHRPQDAHDVLGTWQIVCDAEESTRTPGNAGDLAALLKSRHATMMKHRPGMAPGTFKTARNKAGSTVFVAPDLVAGTLERGFALHRSLETPFQRAVFVKFLVSEVHPFADGNGRVARVMMNAELVAAGEERMVIPTVYRASYLSSLKAISNSGNPTPLIRVLDYAQRWTRAVQWGSLRETERELEGCNAFLDSSEAEEVGKRLRMPDGIS